MPEEHRIVVGVDGSEPSMAALRWAVRQAQLTGAPVDAVMAWRFPADYGWSTVMVDVDIEGESRKELSAALADISGLAPEVAVRPVLAEGPAAEVLVRVAAGADLLVVASRGRGGLASAVLGSVSLGCVLRAPCPVLVVRE